MHLQRFYHAELAVNTYLVGDAQSNQFAVIDPICSIEPLLEVILARGYRVLYILETHVHADFISGAKELKAHLPKSTICCSQLGGAEWTPLYADKLISDGDKIQLGSCHLEARHTPGHSLEHLIWLGYDNTRSQEVPCLAFTGDLLFVGSVGRPDLLGAEQSKLLAHELYKSLFERLKDMPSFLEIYPAHGSGSLCSKSIGGRASSTWGYECLFNAFLEQQPQGAWIDNLLCDMPAAPQSFARVKQLNVQGMAVQTGTKLKSLEAQAVQSALQAGAFLIDMRDVNTFSARHLKSSVNIPFCAAFCSWSAMVVAPDKPLILIVPSEKVATWAAAQLSTVSLDNILGYAMWTSVQDLADIDTLTLRSTREMAELQSCPQHYILDVRMPAEWRAGHVEHAHHIELASLPSALHLIPQNQSITVICAGGLRASTAASLLQRHGFIAVANLKGGMQAWQSAGLPIC